MPPSDQAPVLAIGDLNAAFDELGIPNVLIGGVAVSMIAAPRHTEDLDIIILCDTARAGEILEVLGRHGFQPRFEGMEELARLARLVTVEIYKLTDSC